MKEAFCQGYLLTTVSVPNVIREHGPAVLRDYLVLSGILVNLVIFIAVCAYWVW